MVRGDDANAISGHIESFDNRINTGSGTIRARARFANSDGRLIAGMYVSVRMGAGMLDDALLVPESAIGNDQSKRFVFVVGEGQKAEYRAVQLGPQVDGNRVVLTGLKAGDRSSSITCNGSRRARSSCRRRITAAQAINRKPAARAGQSKQQTPKMLSNSSSIGRSSPGLYRSPSFWPA